MSWYKYSVNKEDRHFFDQKYSDDTGTWSVPDIHEYAVENGKEVDVPIEKLMNNLEPSEFDEGEDFPGHPLFIERAEKSDLKFPIIVIKYPDGLWIADGVHRLWKAKESGHEKIHAYLISHKDLEDIEKSKEN